MGSAAEVAEVAGELRSIARASGSAAGYFPALYSRVTSQIAVAIEEATFDGPERMGVLASRFASYYLRAARSDAGRPRCWQATWDVAGNPGLLIVQHLLLGINAHVNHDLPLAVVDVASAGGEMAPIRRDFDAVNDVLASTYTIVLRDLDRVSRWTNEVAGLGGGRAFNFSLRVARGQAWGAAERLYGLEADARAGYAADLDRLVSVLAYLVTRPALPVRPLLWMARRLEERDPALVVEALLGEHD